MTLEQSSAKISQDIFNPLKCIKILKLIQQINTKLLTEGISSALKSETLTFHQLCAAFVREKKSNKCKDLLYFYWGKGYDRYNCYPICCPLCTHIPTHIHIHTHQKSPPKNKNHPQPVPILHILTKRIDPGKKCKMQNPMTKKC